MKYSSPPVFLLTGLSGAGKTTLAKRTVALLDQDNHRSLMLDGDIMRKTICADLGFSLEDRTESLRRVAQVAHLFAEQGISSLCSCIAPLHEQRRMFQNIIGDNYHEIFIQCPLDVCQNRDVKGMYAKVRSGLITQYTGIASPYEEPLTPHLTLPTHSQSVEESLAILHKYILGFI